MKKIFASVGLAFIVWQAAAQTLFYNNNQQVFVNNQAVIIVKNGDFENHLGSIENNGNIIVEGSFINQDVTQGGSNTSAFNVQKNWENNGQFIAQQSEVVLNGNLQAITGSQVTTFYDLTLENGGIKTQTIDAKVQNILDLGTAQLATGNQKMWVENPQAQAIVFVPESGFVSSQNTGRLVRNTNTTEEYLFPVGQIVNGLQYRPISLKPSTSNENQYEVSLIYDQAAAYGYPSSAQNGSLANINDNYFHYINQIEGNEQTKLAIFYKPAEDGTWNEIAQWQDTEWAALGNITNTSNANFSIVEKNNWLSNQDEPHILANLKEGLLYAIPNVFAPNGAQAENTFFGIINQNGLVKLEHMQIFDRWGMKVFDSKNAQTDTWNGYYDGKLQATGNYTYLIYLKDNNDNALEPITGNFLLIW